MELRILTILSGIGIGIPFAGADPEPVSTRVDRSSSEFIRHLRTDDLQAICKDLSSQAVELKKENRLLKEELNELYLKYDDMAAAFGEMNHFIKEAAAVPARYSGEDRA